MKKYFAGVLSILVLAIAFFSGQKLIAHHQIPTSNAATSPLTQVQLSYTISQAKNNHVTINQTYDVYLVSNDETVTPAELGGGFDQGHPDYSGDYTLLSTKNGKGVSDFALNNLITDRPKLDFTDDMPHNGIQKFIDPITGQQFVTLYQYGSSATEFLYMFRVDNSGQILAVNFYDDKGNPATYTDTNYDGSVSSFFDKKTSIGVCDYYNADIKTLCSEYENRNGDFYLVKSKVFNGQPVLLK